MKTEFVKLQKKLFGFFGIKQKLLQKIEIREYFVNNFAGIGKLCDIQFLLQKVLREKFKVFFIT